MLLRKSLFLMVLLLFSLLSSLVVSADLQIVSSPRIVPFSLSSSQPGSVSVCKCSHFVDSFLITNNNLFSDKFSVSLLGPASSFASLSSDSFELLPGQSFLLLVNYSVPCSLDSGSFVSEVVVSDILGFSKNFSRTLSVSDCSNLFVSLSSDASDEVEPCSTINYNLLIQNTGSFAEVYSVYFGDSFSSPFFINGSSFNVSVSPGSFAFVSNSLKLPCSFSGSIDIPFHVEALNSGFVADLNHELFVKPDFDFSLVSLSNLNNSFCSLDNHLFSFLITNVGAVPNNYSISLISSDDSVFSLSDDFVSLEPGSSKLFTINFNPHSLGSYNLSVVVNSSLGSYRKVLNFALDSVDCYSLDISILQDHNIETCSDILSVPFSVFNNGLRPVNVSLSLLAPAFVSLPVDYLSLNPFESRNLSFIINSDGSESFDGLIYLSASIPDKNVVVNDSINLKLLSDYDCYKPILVNDHLSLIYGTNVSVFTIINSGLKPVLYEARFSGDPWLRLDEDSAFFKLGPSESHDVRLFNYQVFENVSKNHYEGLLTLIAYTGNNSFTYDYPVVVDLHDKPFLVRAYNYFSAHPCHFVSLSLFVILVLLLIVLAFVKRKLERNIPFLLLLLSLWLFAVVVSLLIYGFPQPLHQKAPVNHDPLNLVMLEDSVLSLNLSDYFVDPDGDKLTFTVDPISNFSVRVHNNIAVFKPDPDWFGTRRFRIYAFDGKSGAIPSPRMTITVLDTVDYSPWSFYVKYCLYFNLLLLLFVALAFYFVFSRSPRVPKPVNKKIVKKKLTLAIKNAAGNKVVKKSAVKKTKSAVKKTKTLKKRSSKSSKKSKESKK